MKTLNSLSHLMTLWTQHVCRMKYVLAFVVKDCIRNLAVPLEHIFNLMWQSSIFPQIWKLPKVRSVFKSGNHAIVTNRPMSIICNFTKLFESILIDNIYAHILPKMSYSQHGFIWSVFVLWNSELHDVIVSGYFY